MITGHTGFKGSWLTIFLAELGAEVYGYSLEPPTEPNMFGLCGLEARVVSQHGDINDLEALKGFISANAPDVIFHLAAQSLVRLSYVDPVATFNTNAMGTVNVLEAARLTPSVRAVVAVTSDKCYENKANVKIHVEDDPLGGADPYSASKGCAEIVSAAFAQAFAMPVATVRAGNVIGGGDWGVDRLVPDCIRSLSSNEPGKVRNPLSVRPWQHVLDPLAGYILVAENLLRDGARQSGGWNFGPPPEKAVSVQEVVEKLIRHWGSGSWAPAVDPNAPAEAPYLNLDSSKAGLLLGWRARLGLDEALDWSVSWYRRALEGATAAQMYDYTLGQISLYQSLGVNA